MSTKTEIILEKPQKRLGVKGLIIFIVLMDTFIPLSTDMYLPAMPTMGQHMAASDSIVKLSVTGFFLFYAIGMLVWGPLSDKYGRRKPLLCGLALYTTASFSCMISWNIYMLLFSRVFQGIGAASVTAISMAMIKDCFSGKTRETILALVQTFSSFGPILAPIAGSWLLLITDWRGIFLVLMLFGIIGLVLTFLYEDSLSVQDRLQGSVFQSFGHLRLVMSNKTFMWIVLIYSVTMIPLYAYLNMSSYIYVNFFDCTEQVYSYYFAACALFSMAGPYLYIKLLSTVNKNKLTYTGFAFCLAAGIGMITIGKTAPYWFCLTMFIFYLATNILRPFSTNLILEQQKNDVGTASSVMNMCFNLFGCFGMLLASLPFSNLVVAIGMMVILASLAAILGWWGLRRSSCTVLGIQD